MQPPLHSLSNNCSIAVVWLQHKLSCASRGAGCVQTMSAQLREDVCGAFGDAPLHDDTMAEEGHHALQLPDMPHHAPSPSHTGAANSKHQDATPTTVEGCDRLPVVPATPCMTAAGSSLTSDWSDSLLGSSEINLTPLQQSHILVQVMAQRV